jgi:hypothetical protein
MKRTFMTLIIAASMAACNNNDGHLIIDSKSNIFLSGITTQPQAESDSGRLPVSVSIPAGKSYAEFSGTSGNISCGQSFFDADGGSCGGGSTDLQNMGNVSGIINNNSTMFLAGVFLSNNPDAANIPQRMDASNANSSDTIKPLLQQTFYIGNGLTDKKTAQHFVIPKGATKLYLGFADGMSFHGTPGAYSDNKDSVVTNISWH